MHQNRFWRFAAIAFIGVMFCRMVWADPVVVTSPNPSPNLSPQHDLKIDEGTLDDALLKFAHDTNSNVIADATQYPENAVAKPLLVNQRSMASLAPSFANTEKLSWLKADNSSYLFWSRPDMHDVIRRIANGEGNSWLFKEPAAYEPPRMPGDLTPLLGDYLKQNFKWDGIDRNFTCEIPFYLLPSELHDVMTARTQVRMMQMSESNTAVLSDDFWAAARVGIDHIPANTKTEYQHFIVGVPMQAMYLKGPGFSMGFAYAAEHPVEKKGGTQ